MNNYKVEDIIPPTISLGVITDIDTCGYGMIVTDTNEHIHFKLSQIHHDNNISDIIRIRKGKDIVGIRVTVHWHDVGSKTFLADKIKIEQFKKDNNK